MSDGGISKKTVKMITEKSRVIKDYIDLRIYNLIDTVQIDASFLVQSPVIVRILQKMKNKYEITPDLFKQAFDSEFGFNVLTARRWEIF